MRNSVSKLSTIIMVAGLTACAGQVANHNTPSGKAEVCISPKVKSEKITSALANNLINRQYNVTQQNSSVVSGDRPMTGTLESVLLGSRFDSTPNSRVTYNIMQSTDCTRVVANLSAVTNPSTAFERFTDMNRSKDAFHTQSELEQIKKILEQ